ncbi:MAG TPA: hypothetical protein VMT76_11765 [Puia sp.]|nr:hypothetical protein [Puia sp.]
MKKFLAAAVILSVLFINQNCKKSNGSSNNGNGQDTSKPQPTAVGIPTGNITSKVIGANGGTVVSADGTVELDIPPGALANDTTIGIQPITNNCPGGFNNAFRFTPNGLKFSQPATLKFHYPDSVLEGTIPELMGIATQVSNGYWKVATKMSNDTATHTIATSIRHFTDYTPMELIGLKARPRSIRVNDSSTVQVLIQALKEPDADDPEERAIINKFLDNTKDIAWAVNGITNGNDQVGRFLPHEFYPRVPQPFNDFGYYRAPSVVPSQNNPVTVTATINMTLSYNDVNFNKIIIYTHVLVYGGGYHVTLTFEADSVNESGALWNITDTGRFDVLQTSTTSTMGSVVYIRNQDATVTFVSNNGTCTVTNGPPAPGPIHVLDSGVVLVDPFQKMVNIVFNNALNQKYNVPFPSWKWVCGVDQGTLGGDLGPCFPAYLQFDVMDTTTASQTIILTPQYKMVVEPFK